MSADLGSAELSLNSVCTTACLLAWVNLLGFYLSQFPSLQNGEMIIAMF